MFDGYGEGEELLLGIDQKIKVQDLWQPLLPKINQEKFEQPKIFLIVVIFYFIF